MEATAMEATAAAATIKRRPHPPSLPVLFDISAAKDYAMKVSMRFVWPILILATVMTGTPSTATLAAHPVWATYNAATHTANLTVISSYGSTGMGNASYNFNGGANGHFVFTVPLHARVNVTYSNMSRMMPHGAEIVVYTPKLPSAFPPPAPAFAGAASPNYKHGTHAGIVQHFSFVANKAGAYYLICPVRNHVKFGHWAWFIVSSTAKTATGVLK